MTKKSAGVPSEFGLQMSLAPKRLFNRREAALYMGLSLRKFDKIKPLFRAEVDGVIRYDRVLMDRHIDLSHAA